MKKIYVLPLFAALAILLGGWSCTQSQQQTALKASHDFASTMTSAQQTVVLLHNKCSAPGVPTGCETISDSEDKLLQEDFLAISKCGPNVDSALASGSKDAVRTAINNCNTELEETILNGAAGIKNPEAKQSVTELLIGAQTVLDGITLF